MSESVSVMRGLASVQRITLGAVYVYRHDRPPGRRRKRYRAVRLVTDVPSYQEKILVEGLDGPDAGCWFTCTPANFLGHYGPAGD